MSDPKDIVERGYDAIADTYAAWAREIEGSPAVEWLERLADLLPEGARVLDLGCGNGEPAARILAPNHHYTGVDISREQLRRAALSNLADELIHGDFTKLDFERGSFAAVVAVHALNHVPRRELPLLLTKIGGWLDARGYLLASFSCSGGEGVEDDWLGVPMFFASYTADETRTLLREAGFGAIRDELVTIVEPGEGAARFLWVLARAQGRATHG